jgi:translation initiation factor IF-2
MEQRRLRLGDILDDYCPRERRVTNHAVVAMIEEDVKQTRCTTCDSEHAYKGARVPKRRKKETPSALYKEVLAGMPEVEDAPVLAAAVPSVAAAAALPELPSAVAAEPESVLPATVESTPAPALASEEMVAGYAADEPPVDAPVVDGPVHRPLIRATLPRPEGQKDARPVPDFTARHVPARGANHGGFRDRMRMRGGAGNGSGNSYGNAYGQGNGNRSQKGPRFQGNRPAGSGRPPMGRAGGQGFGNGNGNGNKRGRGSRG